MKWKFNSILIAKCCQCLGGISLAISAPVPCKWLLDTWSHLLYGFTVRTYWSSSSLRMAFHHVSHVSPVPSWFASPVVSRNQCPLTRPRNWPPCPVHNSSLSAIGVAAVYKWKQLVGSGSANDLIMSFNRSISIKTRIWGLLVRVMVCNVERAEVQSVFCAGLWEWRCAKHMCLQADFLTYFPAPWHPSRLAANAPPVPRKPGEKKPLTYGETSAKGTDHVPTSNKYIQILYFSGGCSNRALIQNMSKKSWTLGTCLARPGMDSPNQLVGK